MTKSPFEMEALLLKIDKRKSKFGDQFFYGFFKGVEDGKSYRSCIYKKMGNYKRWAPLLKEGNVLGNLLVKAGNIIDADSYPRKVGFEELKKPEDKND